MSETASLRALDDLIEDLTVDAYGGNDQRSGFLAGAQEALQRGEPARIARIDV
jgi:hypothetical protein